MNPTDRASTDDTSARLILLGLPGMGPARLNWLLGQRDAPAVVDDLRGGRLPVDLGPPPPGLVRSDLDRWLRGVGEAESQVDGVLAANRELGVRLMSPLDDLWPFADDPEPPGLLFYLGDPELLRTLLAVAVVGTRRCTALGRTVADRLGRDLAKGGAVVVSGLALGVDGAAHRGALDEGEPVIGVVASGLDVVYPRANRQLWGDVIEQGLLVSEVPTGTRPNRWRFPARNRMIAGLSDAVVVVESHERGGALSTADEAIRRDVPVMVVPGSVLSPASEGTNNLLIDGAVPIRDAVDVLAYLGRPIPPSLAEMGGGGLVTTDSGSTSSNDADGQGTVIELPTAGRDPRPEKPLLVGSIGRQILAEVATGPVHLDRLVLLTGRPVAEVLIAVQELESSDLVAVDGSTVNHPGGRSR